MSGNLSEAPGLAQLAEGHGDKLAPIRESFGVMFGLGQSSFLYQIYTKSGLNHKTYFGQDCSVLIEWKR